MPAYPHDAKRLALLLHCLQDAPFQRDDFALLQGQHWQIDQYQRAIKQVCHIEHFQVRSERPVRSQIFVKILSFVYL